MGGHGGFGFGLGGGHGFVGGFGFFFLRGFPPLFIILHGLLAKIVIAGMVGGSVGGFAVCNAMGVRMLPKGIRSKLIGAVRSTIWRIRKTAMT